jgi:putative peptidoglycan lipid II flippase
LQPIYALAVGVMLGGLSQLALQFWALHRLGLRPRLAMAPGRIAEAARQPSVGTILRNMAPALLGVGVAQLSLLINTQIASHMAAGSVSWLTYADRLMEFPTALLGVALGVVLTPQLASAQARGDTQSYSDLLDWGLRLTLLLALPCAAALLVFAQPMVAVLYHYGKFEAVDVSKTAYAVMGWGVGLVGLIGVKILAPGYFARQDVRTPVKVALVVLVCTQVFNALLVPWLGHAALALSIGLGALLNALWLLKGLRRKAVYQPAAGWLGLLWRVLLATALMAALLLSANLHIDWVALRAQPGLRAAWLALTLALAASLYFGTLLLTGLPLKQFVRRGR